MINISEVIAFTGHRDKVSGKESLDDIAKRFGVEGILWVHGGAPGFDSQVEEYAKEHGIPTQEIRPNYREHGNKAPLFRDRQIVDMCNVLVACYDGRQFGGTFYTLQYAKKQGKEIIEVSPAKRVMRYR